MQDTSDEARRKPATGDNGDGCLRGGLLTTLGGWILFATVVYQAAVWFQEQGLFEGSITTDTRWLWTVFYALAVGIPSTALIFGTQNRFRAVSTSLALAGGFALLQAPSRLAGIDEAQVAALLQIGGLVVFLLLSGLAAARYQTRKSDGSILPALAAGAMVLLPWVLWGALGSIADVVLQIITAALFGWAVFRTLQPVFYSGGNLLVDGLVAALVLVVMATGLGVNGSQWLLALALPLLGWGLAALGLTGEPEVANRRGVSMLAGLAAFGPLAFVDPDELSLIVTLGPGELIQWAGLAAFLSGGLALLSSLLLAGLRGRLGGAAAAVLTGMAWLLVLLLYVVIGQPGLHGERLFVVLNTQADVSALAGINDPAARREEAYRLLVSHADTTQAPIRQVLDRLWLEYQPYYMENALEVQGGPLLRLWLETRPEVDRVLDSPVLRPLPAAVPITEGFASAPQVPEWNLQMIGADQVWDEFGVTGEGIVVGQADSGAEGTHAELADSYRGRDGENDYNWFDPWNHSPAPVDIGGHGTHTLGTVLGNTTGVAPDAEWIGCVNLARNLGNPALYLDCMQFLFAPFPQGGDPLTDGRPELGAQVLNNSWGCPPVEGCDAEVMRSAVDALRAAGVFVVVSAGNDGDGGETCGSLRDPIAIYDSVYSVGAVDSSRSLASFSSVGPVSADGSGRTKPDITAPGVQVLSAYPGGTYDTASGTSMAGPHLTGVVALMWSANPDLIGEIETTEEILNSTAQPYESWLPDCVPPGTPNSAVGYGIVDAYAAVREALGR